MIPGCLFWVVFNSVQFHLSRQLTRENHGIVESKEKRELCIHLLHSATNYIKTMRYWLISPFNVKYGRQHKLKYNSMPSAFSLAKKLNLLQRHRNWGSGGYTPSDKVGRRGRGGGQSSRPRTVSKKLFLGLSFWSENKAGAAPRAPSLDPPLCGHVTSRHVLSIQFGDNHVVWSEANYYCS